MSNNGQPQLQFDLKDFDFSMDYRSRRAPSQKDYDMLIGFRTAGRKRKNFGCDISLTHFIQRLENEQPYKKMAIGISRFKKQSSILAVFDNEDIPEFGLINHNKTGNTDTYTINNKGMVIKMLGALGCDMPDKADCDVRCFCKLITVSENVFKVEPMYVEYTDANDAITKKQFRNGVLENTTPVHPSSKRF